MFIWTLNLGIALLTLTALYFGGYSDAPGGMLSNLGIAYRTQPCWMHGLVVVVGIFGMLASLRKREKPPLVAFGLMTLWGLPGLLNLGMASSKVEVRKALSVEHWVRVGSRGVRTPMTRFVLESGAAQETVDIRGDRRCLPGEDLQVTYNSGFLYQQTVAVEAKEPKNGQR